MAAYLTIDEICTENTTLKNKIIVLEEEIVKLKETISRLTNVIETRNDENAWQILDYFNSTHSIRQTAYNYGMEMEELFELIPEWDGCRDGLQGANDYDDCRIEIIGRKYYDEEKEEGMNEDELKYKRRKPDSEEVANIISNYIEGYFSLYELVDRYELQINMLFHILKENNLIEKETDAKGYSNFYEEHMGSGCEWDSKSELGLLD